jgi:OFA family oxalate/formate antiporter-like MFS transporter
MTENRWLPVLGGILMNLALGSLYAWSVFVIPLEQEFGWTRADTSWVYTIAVVCFALTFIWAGRLQDRRGPKLCAFAGGILVSLGFFLVSFTTSLAMLYVFFGELVGVGNGFGYSTPMPVASKWFPDKRGLVVGLMVGGYGGGQAIFGTLASASLIPSLGWRTTFQILAAIFFVMTMCGAMLLRNPPPGYRPAGWTPPAVAPGVRTDFTTAEMLRTSTFYFLWIAFAFGTTAGQMAISQLVPFARTAGLGATIATYSLVVTSFGNAGGRVLSGWLSDTLGRLPTLKTMVLLSAVAMPALFLWRAQVVPFFVLIAPFTGVTAPSSPCSHRRPAIFRNEEPGPELRRAVHGVGLCRHPRSWHRRPHLRGVRRLSLRIFLGRRLRSHSLYCTDARKTARPSSLRAAPDGAYASGNLYADVKGTGQGSTGPQEGLNEARSGRYAGRHRRMLGRRLCARPRTTSRWQLGCHHRNADAEHAQHAAGDDHPAHQDHAVHHQGAGCRSQQGDADACSAAADRRLTARSATTRPWATR